MSTIFVTDDDSPYSVELAGVGVIGGSGKGGIPVERAALTMPELQDDDGTPLTGAKLRSAAEKYAKAHNLSTRSEKDLDEEALRVAGGGFPDSPGAREESEKASARDNVLWDGDGAGVVNTPADLPVPETAILPNEVVSATEITTKKEH